MREKMNAIGWRKANGFPPFCYAYSLYGLVSWVEDSFRLVDLVDLCRFGRFMQIW